MGWERPRRIHAGSCADPTADMTVTIGATGTLRRCVHTGCTCSTTVCRAASARAGGRRRATRKVARRDMSVSTAGGRVGLWEINSASKLVPHATMGATHCPRPTPHLLTWRPHPHGRRTSHRRPLRRCLVFRWLHGLLNPAQDAALFDHAASASRWPSLATVQLLGRFAARQRELAPGCQPVYG